MFNPGCEITLGKYVLKDIISFETESSWDKFTDTARIVLPKMVVTNTGGFKINSLGGANDQVEFEDLIQRNEKVVIKAGYNGNRPVLFEGYIASVMPGDQVTVICEDLMYALKQVNVESISWLKDAQTDAGVTLQTVIDHIVQDLNIETSLLDPDADLGEWVIDNNNFINAVEVLKKLKETYGLVSYIKDNELVVGGLRSIESAKTRVFVFQHNIKSDSLNYQDEDFVRTTIKGISNLPDNTKIVRYAYWDGLDVAITETERTGELTTKNYYNLDADALEAKITDELPRVGYTGFKGSFTTFLEPQMSFGDIAYLKDLTNPERDGKYKIKSVKTNFSNSAYEQQITLDYKIV
jgi:hypothetical protein